MKNDMHVLKYLDELTETVRSKGMFGKVLIDREEVEEIIADIRKELPEELEQARWLLSEKDNYLNKGREEYNKIVTQARKEADALVSENIITARAHEQADEMLRAAEKSTRDLKINAYEFLDKILFSMQEKMNQLNKIFIKDVHEQFEAKINEIHQMYTQEVHSEIQKKFEEVDEVLEGGIKSIQAEAHKVDQEYKNKKKG